MDHRKAGLLLTSAALILYSCVLPFLRRAGPVTVSAHFIMGLALGAGLALMIGTFVKRRFGSRCER